MLRSDKDLHLLISLKCLVHDLIILLLENLLELGSIFSNLIHCPARLPINSILKCILNPVHFCNKLKWNSSLYTR